MAFNTKKSILQKLQSKLSQQHKVQLFVKRDDLIHPFVSGNKWRKLKYNIEQFYTSNKESVTTFGGAYSNHLLATASACNQLEIQAIGVVRGEELQANSNGVLEKCAELGMQLHFISRSEYRLKLERPFLEKLSAKFENTFILPEGGANYYGCIGCQEIMQEVDVQYDHVFVAQGTTTTSCGIALGMQSGTLHVVPALKGFDAKKEMQFVLQQANLDATIISEIFAKTQVHDDYHFGGYCKYTDELLTWKNEVEKEFGIPLDKIYTAKAFYALFEQIRLGKLDNSTVIFVHTGGVHQLD